MKKSLTAIQIIAVTQVNQEKSQENAQESSKALGSDTAVLRRSGRTAVGGLGLTASASVSGLRWPYH